MKGWMGELCLLGEGGMDVPFGMEPVELGVPPCPQHTPLALHCSFSGCSRMLGSAGAVHVTGHVRKHTGQTTRLRAVPRTSVSPSSSVCPSPASPMPAWPSCWRATQGESPGKEDASALELSSALCLDSSNSHLHIQVLSQRVPASIPVGSDVTRAGAAASALRQAGAPGQEQLCSSHLCP